MHMFTYMMLAPLAVAFSAGHPPATRPISRNFLGFNVVNLQSGNFTTDPAYAANTAKVLRAGILRYPGGNLADWWDWKSGWCLPAATTNASSGFPGCDTCRDPCEGKPPRRYMLEEFSLALSASGARAVLVLNMATADLDDQLAFLDHAAAIGVLRSGSYVELGGEFYWGKYAGRWPRAKDYATEANTWAAAIKGRFPGRSISVMAIACYSIEMKAPGDRGHDWNAELYPALGDAIDGVTIHPYLHLGDDAAGASPLQPGLGPRSKSEGPTSWSENITVQRLAFELLQTPTGLEKYFGVPFFLASMADGDLATHAALPTRFRMVVTEWNMMERTGPYKLTWAHALWVATAVFTMLGVAQMDAVLLHVLLNGYGWGGLYETTADFKGPFGGAPPPGSAATATGRIGCLIPQCTGLVTAPYSPTAVGSVLGTLSAAMEVAKTAEPMTFQNVRVMTGGLKPSALPGNVTYPVLLGWKFHGQGGQPSTAAVLNLDSDAIRCAVDHVSYTTLSSPDPGGSPAAWASVGTPVRTHQGIALGQFPAYSLTILNLTTQV